jgi:hypothetical protein
MKVKDATSYILKRMEKELPINLYYHSIMHVMDVLKSANNIAEMEAVSHYERDLLITAVAYHDSGFIYHAKDHEETGCRIVREVLPNYDYNDEQIEQICGMIMSTKIPQKPHNLLEEIICDADLDYLGRDDFWTIGTKLFHELTEMGILQNEEEWNKLQLNFLENHHYFTNSAKLIREKLKLEHLNKVSDIVKSYK